MKYKMGYLQQENGIIKKKIIIYPMKNDILLSLLSNTEKLNSLVKSDNYVYDTVNIKLTDEITKITGLYNNQEKELEIVNIDNSKYAKCQIPILKKSINGFSIIFNEKNDIYSINLKCYNNDTIIKEFRISANDVAYENKNITGGLMYLTGNEITELSAGDMYLNYNSYNREELKSDCYINIAASKNLGDTLNLEPFGTLQRVEADKKSQEHGYQYQYQAKVKDKTLFNKDDIYISLVLPKYNIMHFA